MSKGQETEQEKHASESVSDEDLMPILTDLRVNKGKTMREIAEDTGLALSKVGRMLKGVEPAEKPDSKEPQQRQPQYMPIMIRKEDAAKLYALAIDEGYEGVEDFLSKSMLPWYRVKRDFEWKLKMKIVPKQFQLYIESVMADSIELQQFKEEVAKMGKKPEQEAIPPGSSAGGARN